MKRYREAIVIERQGLASVAFIALDELESLQTTAHLLCSPRNAQRLLNVLNQELINQRNADKSSEVESEAGKASLSKILCLSLTNASSRQSTIKQFALR